MENRTKALSGIFVLLVALGAGFFLWQERLSGTEIGNFSTLYEYKTPSSDCPADADVSKRTIITFLKHPIAASYSPYRIEPMPVLIEPGTYKITLYAEKVVPEERWNDERWHLVLSSERGTRVVTRPVDDIPNEVDIFQQIVEEEIKIPETMHFATAWHHLWDGVENQYPPNLIIPTCAVLDQLESAGPALAAATSPAHQLVPQAGRTLLDLTQSQNTSKETNIPSGSYKVTVTGWKDRSTKTTETKGGEEVFIELYSKNGEKIAEIPFPYIPDDQNYLTTVIDPDLEIPEDVVSIVIVYPARDEEGNLVNEQNVVPVEIAFDDNADSSPTYSTPTYTSPTGGSGVVSGPTCTSLSYTQPTGAVTDRLAILFVPDTSRSLDAERRLIADNIDQFVADLPSGSDFTIGVLLAHGDSSPWSGRLYQAGNEPLILDSTSMSLSSIRSNLRTKLTNYGPRGDDDPPTDGGEVGMYSLSRFLGRGADGFIRSGGALAVIFLADENDICAEYPEGVVPVPDPQGAEIRTWPLYCPGLTTLGVYQKLRDATAGLPLSISGVLYTGEHSIPAGDENEIGYGYIDLIELNSVQDSAVDLAGGNIAGELSDIGKFLSERLVLKTEFELPHQNIIESSIKVNVDNISVSFTYNRFLNEVQLQDGGGPGSNVEINYCFDSGDGSGGSGGIASLSLSDREINEGGSATLSWQCPAGTTSSAGHGFSTGGVPSGSVTVTPDDTITYTVVCSDGARASGTLVVRHPRLEIQASPSIVRPDNTSEITWSASGVDSCFVEGSDGSRWTGRFGSETSRQLNEITTFTLHCTSSGGETSASVEVIVVPILIEF